MRNFEGGVCSCSNLSNVTIAVIVGNTGMSGYKKREAIGRVKYTPLASNPHPIHLL
jgi:hypothetical protein